MLPSWLAPPLTNSRFAVRHAYELLVGSRRIVFTNWGWATTATKRRQASPITSTTKIINWAWKKEHSRMLPPHLHTRSDYILYIIHKHLYLSVCVNYTFVCASQAKVTIFVNQLAWTQHVSKFMLCLVLQSSSIPASLMLLTWMQQDTGPSHTKCKRGWYGSSTTTLASCHHCHMLYWCCCRWCYSFYNQGNQIIDEVLTGYSRGWK